MQINFTKKHLLWGISLLGLAAVVAVFVWSRQPGDLRTALARALNRNKEQIFLNLPPFDGRYPGTLLFTPAPGVTLTRIKETHPTHTPSAITHLEVHLGDADKAYLSSSMLGSLSSAGDLEISLQLDSLRSYEIDLDSSLKAKAILYRALLNDPAKNPVFIYRSYEAIPTFQIRKTSALSAKAWQAVEKNSLAMGGTLNADGEILFKNEKPVVIAYEVIKADVLASTLSAGTPDKVAFTQVLAEQEPVTKTALTGAGLVPASGGVRYMCIGNAAYQNPTIFGKLDFVTPSIETVQSIFTRTGASPLLPSPPVSLSQRSLEELISHSVAKMKQVNDSLLVVYYVGHAVTGPGGQSYLVLSDYQGDPQKDLGEESGLGLFRYQMNQPSHPLAGSNLGQLLDLSNALQAEYPREVHGLYPVSRMYAQLKQTGKPFLLLIDACYDHSQMRKLREELHLSNWGDYYGPSEVGGEQQLAYYKSAIQDFGVAPYLNTSNVVLFSSAPGSVAVEAPDPRPHFGRPTFVGPLARRLSDGLEQAIADGEPTTWGAWLQPLVDVKATGESRIKGTASWSDFTLLKRRPLLQAASSQ